MYSCLILERYMHEYKQPHPVKQHINVYRPPLTPHAAIHSYILAYIYSQIFILLFQIFLD